jgi:hypothetical protein
MEFDIRYEDDWEDDWVETPEEPEEYEITWDEDDYASADVTGDVITSHNNGYTYEG